MINALWILAQAAPTPDAAAEPPPAPPPWLHSAAQHIPHQMDLLAWSQQMTPGVATILILLGLVYMLFGIRIFKMLVMLNAAIVGGFLGVLAVGAHGEGALACGLIGAVLAAAIAWPIMKYAVAIMGGIFGAMLGASVWHTLSLAPDLVWAGALVGLVGFGLLSFVLFNGSVMMYTSLQGSFMMVFGVLGLLYKYADLAPKVTTHLNLEPYLLPALVLVPAVLGLIFQQHHATGHGGGGGGKK